METENDENPVDENCGLTAFKLEDHLQIINDSLSKELALRALYRSAPNFKSYSCCLATVYSCKVVITYFSVDRKQCPIDAGAKWRYTTRCGNSRATQSGATLCGLLTC